MKLARSGRGCIIGSPSNAATPAASRHACRSWRRRTVLSRAAILMASGAAGGGALLLLIVSVRGSSGRPADDIAPYVPWLAVTALVMLAAGVLAALGPARRALRINPTDALRDA